MSAGYERRSFFFRLLTIKNGCVLGHPGHETCNFLDSPPHQVGPFQVEPFQVGHFRLGPFQVLFGHFRFEPFQVDHFRLGPFQVRAISGWAISG